MSRTPAFSNGTDWELWRERWCDDCLWDALDGCPLVERLLLHLAVPQVVEKRGVVRCTQWSPS